MMKMMMVKRSVVTSHRADGGSPSPLSPFVSVVCSCFCCYAIVIADLVMSYKYCCCCKHFMLFCLFFFCFAVVRTLVLSPRLLLFAL